MSNPSTAGSWSRISAVGPSPSRAAPRPRPPDIITYSYASQLVYVAPAETHDNAIDIAKESFRELKDVERGRIHFEVKVDLGKMQQTGTAEIGRGAWPLVVPSLARFEIVEIRIAPVATHGQTGVALSSSQASAVGPPAYSPENNEYSYEQQIPSSRSSSPPSLITRIVNFFTCRSRPSP